MMNRVKMIVGVALACAAVALVWTLIGGCNRSVENGGEEAAAAPGGDFIPGETLPEQAQSRHVAEGGPTVVQSQGESLPESAPAGEEAPAPAKAPAPATAAAPAKASAPEKAVEVYVVRKGDTLSSISRRTGVPVKALIEANSITDPRKISVGQKLILPSGQ